MKYNYNKFVKSIIIIFLELLIMPQISLADTNIPEGNVNGSWLLENSPYYINGEITIPDSQTLTIEPGVEVIFNDYYKFNVQGKLLAVGTQTDSIHFTVADTSGFSNFSWGNTDGGWGGIEFDNTRSTNDSSKIVFSKIQYCKANPTLEFRYYDKVLINYCLLDNNASVSYWNVIDCSHSSPIFKDVIISNSRGYEIYCSYSNSSFENVTLTNSGCHIQFSNSNITIDNLKVSNNDSDSMEGGIVNCDNSTINISNSTVSNNTGRGIFITDNSNASIINSNIFGNYGGGILCSESDLSLLNVNIYNNNAGYLGGGGIKIYVNSVLNISNVTINNNSAHYGGGIYFDSAPNFNSISNFNIYNNIAVSNGNDLYNDTSQIVHIIVDTFTVSNPTETYAYPINKFTFDILHGLKTLIDSDLYVDPVNGNNENTGITSDSPFLTIGFALDNIFYNSSDTHTLHLLDGIYSPSTNGEVFPINCLSYVSLAGTEEGPVILDAEESNTVIRCTNVHDLSIENIIVTNGLSTMGGGFYCNNNYNLNLSNLLIYGNSSNKGGGLHCCASYLTLTNVTSVRNEAIFGGGMYCWQGTSVNLINCIFYYDLYSDEVYFAPYNYYYAPCQITVSYSNIQGGESAGIVTNNWGTVNWQEGNIDNFVFFQDGENEDYHLSYYSPCIDAGNPDTTGLNLPVYDLDGNPRIVNGIIDMGAYEYQGGLAYTNIKVFLEGTYNAVGDTMVCSLTVPTTSPYNSEFIGSLPTVTGHSLVDWIQVKLRTTATGSTIDSCNAFLLEDGSVVDVNGNSSLPFYNTSGNEYYIVIHHRNHLDIMSAVKYTFGSSQGEATNINLTTSGSIYGDGYQELETGVYGMYSGDINNDGEVTTSDYTSWYNAYITGSSGYQTTDLDLDGEVTTSDYTKWYNNFIIGASSSVPGQTRESSGRSKKVILRKIEKKTKKNVWRKHEKQIRN